MWLERCKEMQEDTRKNSNHYLVFREIDDNNIKSQICNIVLRNLPEWFGIEESIQEYV